ncbi:GDSL esterase/lipase-like protein [Drosera capensis]
MGVRGGSMNLKQSMITTELVLIVVIMGLSTCLGKQVSAVFVFGDSLVEAGNNNYIVGLSKANTLPYGIDFEDGPTGRFTNGRTIIDIVGQKVGLKDFIPQYLAPNTIGNVILKGVNYASGAGGIFNKSGLNLPLS